MNFNRHLGLEGKHALLSPSYYHWLRYDDQAIEARYYGFSSARRGTDLHALAHEAIRLGVYLAESHEALAAYVNDGIQYRMACEQPLYYSENCFGTPDTIGFIDNLLRIHDLKTGINATSFQQLHIYDALFCLEYDYDPFDIGHELRIYQRDEIRVDEPHPEAIQDIMRKIVSSDSLIESIKGANR